MSTGTYRVLWRGALASAIGLAAMTGAGARQFPGGPPMGPGGPGGPGGPMQQTIKLVARFDADHDGWLNAAERKAARTDAKSRGARGGPGFGPGGPGFGREGSTQTPKAGARVSPAGVQAYPTAKLYDPSVLRTIFLTFENADWETELSDFHGTDVEVPARMTVDGRDYPNVGVRFRGNTSYMMVTAGHKRSLNVSVDLADPRQRLYGYKNLNLLNSHEDSSLMGNVLYSHIARQFTRAPQANYVKVVINGESWGVYVNYQQFDKVFLAESFGSGDGTRWKVPGSPGAAGGLDYKGESVGAYKRVYDQKAGGKDDWKKLIELCRVLNRTSADKLASTLKPVLDIDNVLWFLALDISLLNGDGYWQRASDYSIWCDTKGVFRVFAHDTNETFRSRGGGPGFGPPPGGFGPMGGFGGPGAPPTGMQEGGVRTDPLAGMNDTRTALRSRLLAVPALRARYLQFVRRISAEGLAWEQLGPVVAQYRALIEKDVEADTRKLGTLAAFQAATAADTSGPEFFGRRGSNIRAFADARSKYLLSYTDSTRKSRPVTGAR